MYVLREYAEWQEARQLQYDTREKELEEQSWGCGNTKATKKNIIEFREGLPRSEDSLEQSAFSKINNNQQSYKRIVVVRHVDLFIKDSHHKNFSVILISQNLFHQGHDQRDISLNANYIVISSFSKIT